MVYRDFGGLGKRPLLEVSSIEQINVLDFTAEVLQKTAYKQTVRCVACL